MVSWCGVSAEVASTSLDIGGDESDEYRTLAWKMLGNRSPKEAISVPNTFDTPASSRNSPQTSAGSTSRSEDESSVNEVAFSSSDVIGLSLVVALQVARISVS